MRDYPPLVAAPRERPQVLASGAKFALQRGHGNVSYITHRAQAQPGQDLLGALPHAP